MKTTAMKTAAMKTAAKTLSAASIALAMAFAFVPAAEAQVTKQGAMRDAMRNQGSMPGGPGGFRPGGWHGGGFHGGGFGPGIVLGFGGSHSAPIGGGHVAFAPDDEDCRWVRVFKRWDPVHRRMISRRVLVCD